MYIFLSHTHAAKWPMHRKPGKVHKDRLSMIYIRAARRVLTRICQVRMLYNTMESYWACVNATKVLYLQLFVWLSVYGGSYGIFTRHPAGVFIFTFIIIYRNKFTGHGDII